MEDFYSDFASSFVSGGSAGSPQMKNLMSATAANPGKQDYSFYDQFIGMTPEQAVASGYIQKIETDQSREWDQTTGQINPGFINPYIGYGSRDLFDNQRGRVFGNNQGRLVDQGLQDETNDWADFAKWAAMSAAAGAGAYALGGVAAPTMGGMELATAGAGGLTPGMGGAGLAAGAGGAAAAGGAGAGGAAAPITMGGAGGLPGLLGGAGGLGNLLGGLGSVWDTVQNYRNAGEMRDWLVGQTPDLPFYQQKLRNSYENPGEYFQGADFNAGFDILHNKLQRNDAAGGRLAADAGRQSELQKYTLDSLNNYRRDLGGVVNSQTQARVGSNSSFMQNLNNRADAISPITTFLGNLMGSGSQ